MESTGSSTEGTGKVSYFIHENMPSDVALRNAIKALDSHGYPNRGRSLIIPAQRVFVGEVYGMKVYTGPTADAMIEVHADRPLLTRMYV